MTKADWLVLAGFVLVALGLGLIYRPLALIFCGAICILVARAMATAKKPAAPNRNEDFE